MTLHRHTDTPTHTSTHTTHPNIHTHPHPPTPNTHTHTYTTHPPTPKHPHPHPPTTPTHPPTHPHTHTLTYVHTVVVQLIFAVRTNDNVLSFHKLQETDRTHCLLLLLLLLIFQVQPCHILFQLRPRAAGCLPICLQKVEGERKRSSVTELQRMEHWRATLRVSHEVVD